MARTIEGTLEGGDHRFAVVAARFNELFVDRLVQGALDGLTRHGVNDDAIDVVRVPGSLEIPITAQRLAAKQSYSAIICLGVVIRGATVHFEHVADGAAGRHRPRRACRRYPCYQRPDRGGIPSNKPWNALAQSSAIKASTPPWPPWKCPTCSSSSRRGLAYE